ncbi:MAG: phosphoadenosine phosphosulfate reductase family protein [Ruminococcus sp.]|nr:phosphoadenosine phosphosulfate reductase family protein [Ruminococcus sp.]
MEKPKLHIVSLSGGKDSTAMLLGMIERKMPIDIMLFCDTGLEFPDMYAHLDRLNTDIKAKIGTEITTVRPEHPFEYYFKDIPVKRDENSTVVQRYGSQPKGFGWAGAKMRWCTSRLKNHPRERFIRLYSEQYQIIHYIGIAADEFHRMKRTCNKGIDKILPLVDWGMTEQDCLQYCYDNGYDWNGLYKKFKRVSCWCCPLQPLSELRVLYRDFPELWEQLRKWDSQTWRSFKPDYSVDELTMRFEFESERISKNLSVTNRDFYEELKKILCSQRKDTVQC